MLGDGSGVLNTIQKALKTQYSWKRTRQHCTDERRMSALRQSTELEMAHDDEYSFGACHWPLPIRFLDSPISVLRAYKYVSSHRCSSKRILGDLDSPSSAQSSLTDSSSQQSQPGSNTSGPNDVKINHGPKVESSRSTLREIFAQTEADGYDGVYRHVPCKVASAPSIQEKDMKNSHAEKPVESDNLQGDHAEDDTLLSVGWPLMRRSCPTITNKGSGRTHRMSVVEWALQLPDRQKEMRSPLMHLLQKDMLNVQPLISSEGMCFEEERAEEYPVLCAHDVHLQYCHHGNIVASRLAKLSQKIPFKQFHFVELQAATSNFNADNMVGKGGCSKVYQGILSDGHVVAVKCLKASTLDSEDVFVSEVEIMCGLYHDHIVRLIGYCIDSQHYMLVYNFASKGNLEQKLHGVKGEGALPWESRYTIAVGVAEALKYLHDGCTRPVIHRDVKSSNILLTSNLEPQLTDFGLAKWVPATCTQINCSDVVGTFGYLAPEYVMFGKVSEKTDVYSFGVVLLELITGRRPIDNTKSRGQETLVIWARSLLEDESNADQLIDPKLEGAYNAGQLKNMMLAATLCLRQSPQMRPHMSWILKLLRGDVENLEHISRQDSACKESDDGCDMPNYGDIDIRTHLTLALFGLDDDAV